MALEAGHLVKNHMRDATDLADLRRIGRLPEARIVPPATRELRELVGTGMRTNRVQPCPMSSSWKE